MATLLLATISEVVQLWVPARSFNVMDWVANVAGILLGVIIIRIQDLRRKI
jgi:VanZ family protein